MSRYLFPCLAMALSACATLPAPQITSEYSQQLWKQQVTQLEPLEDWSLRGRVALYVEEDVYNLGISWQRQGSHSQLKLEASLGQGLVMLDIKPNSVNLTTAEGESVHGHNAQQVLIEATGLMIPVEGLQTWIKGIPHDRTDYRHTNDADGRTLTLRQDGWLINFLEYNQGGQSEIEQPPLPRKLYMKHDKLALKIVIDQWQKDPQQSHPGLFPSFE